MGTVLLKYDTFVKVNFIVCESVNIFISFQIIDGMEQNL
jgi:hypothetical protein